VSGPRHVPKHSLSESSLQYLLQTLVLKFENNEPLTIVRSFLRDPGSNPSVHNFNWPVTYPEPVRLGRSGRPAKLISQAATFSLGGEPGGGQGRTSDRLA
jgi:hypothetical protein